MIIHPLEIDKTALWNAVLAVIIGVNILLAIGRLFLLNRYIKYELFHNLFSRKRKEKKNEVKWDKENDEGGV